MGTSLHSARSSCTKGPRLSRRPEAWLVNKEGSKPSDLAHFNGHSDLAEYLRKVETKI